MNHLFDARGYWLERIQALTIAPLPFWPPPAGEASDPVEIEIDTETARRLHELTKGAALLNQAAIIAAVQTALARHTGAPLVVVGSPPRAADDGAGRPNLLPIVQSVAPELRFRDVLSSVRRSLLDAFAIQDIPCGPLLEEVHPKQTPVPIAVALEGFSGELDRAPELLVEARVTPDRVRLRLDGRGRFARGALQAFGEHAARSLAAGLQDHATAIGEIEILSHEERRRILVEWNATAATVPAGSVLTWFEAQAARRPASLALSGERALSYGELDRRANLLAHRLRAHEVGPEVRIGLYLTRPADMVVSILAVLKAGGAYVPLDPDYPSQRIERMLADSGPRVVVTDRELAARLPPTTTTLLLDAEVAEVAEREPDRGALPIGVDPDRLAYIIYTSGSTGEPRGVLITHGGLANAIHSFSERAGVDQHSRVSQICSFSFDASVLEIFLALTRGATLCLAPRAARGAGAALGAFLREEAVTVIGAITPAVLALVAPGDAVSVRSIQIGAEKCPAELADRWAPGRVLLNCYGPTEATIDCMYWPCAGQEGDPPIGRPIANARAYVLDPNLRPVPIGAVGELYIGGAPVARGYHDRPKLTAERFVPDSLSGELGGRLYRTGDLARFRADGRIDFCGRVDRQVKIAGVRIELGEIEAALRTHPAVREAAVTVSTDGTGERRLIAYLVADGSRPSTTALRKHLSCTLPAAMLPSAFVELERMPINANGKVDHEALPAPSAERPRVAGDFAEPQTEIESTLALIWGKILGIDGVGRHDNFFDLGGRSLHVTRVMSKVAKAFHVELPLESMFNAPTLNDLARTVTEALASGQGSSPSLPLVPVAPRPDPLPLSFSQQRLWFLHQVLPPGVAALYNGPIPVRLRGPLDHRALGSSFDEIIRRHEVLRTAFRIVGDQPAQVILPAHSLEIETIDLTGWTEEERLAETERLVETDARRPFNLEHPPLLRAKLVALGAEDHVLLLNIHHIVFDGWSVGVLLNEFSQLYVTFSRGEPSPLPPLPLQYADFAVWQRRWLEGSRIEKQLAYWRTQLAGLQELKLPTDADRPLLPTYRGEVQSFRLSRALVDALTARSREADVTLFMTLLAGLTALLHRYTAQEDIVISSPVASRNRTEIEGLIGFFVNSLVLRTDLSGAPTFRELLARVRRVTLEAYDHQDVPFERLVEVLQPERCATHNPLFRAAFSLQNTPMPFDSPPGLTVLSWETHNKTAKFDLVLAMTDTGDGLAGDVEYSSELFERSTIRELIELYGRLLERVAEDPDRPLLEIPLIEAAPQAPLAEGARGTFEF